jgi:hypothetical protein
MTEKFSALPNRFLLFEELEKIEANAKIEGVMPVDVIREGNLVSCFVLAYSETLHALGFNSTEDEWVVIGQFEREEYHAATTAANEWVQETYRDHDDHEITEIEFR